MRSMSAGRRWALGIAIGFLVLEVGASLFGPYGYFIDELYYLACAKRLAFGYVDHPPLVAVMARLSTALFGESARGLRVLPALCGAATVVLTGELARTLRGDRFAQNLAALCAMVAPEFRMPSRCPARMPSAA